MFSCSSCGGKVVYDIDMGMLRCEFCGTTYNVQTFDEAKTSSVKSYAANVFVCTNCGAEVATTDNDAVSFCSYCGSQSVLFSKTQEAVRPQDMVPFRISRKRMHEIYQKSMAGVKYLPKEFVDPKYIDTMRGIYIPFHAHSVQLPGNLPVTVTRTVSLSSDRERVDTFRATFSPVQDKAKYYTDASAAMDDAITDQILPFPEEGMTGFNPAYLAGFYADRSDVPPEKYIPSLQEKASKDAISSLQQTLGNDYTLVKESNGNPKGFPNGLPVQCTGYHHSLFPVWFLTRRDGDRVSYIVANGATGKFYADLPVDNKKYWISTLIMAAVIFVVLALVMSMTAKSSLGWITLMTAIMLGVYEGELRRVMERETHLFDIGSMTYDPVKAAEYKKKHAGGKAGCLIGLAVIAGLYFFSESPMGPMFSLLSMIFGAVQMVQIFGCGSKIKAKGMSLVGIFSFATLLIGWLMFVFHPVSDLWYYGASILCLLGALLPGALMIRCYNMLASRPLPNFFQRQGGVNDAK